MNPLISLTQIQTDPPSQGGWTKLLNAYGTDLDTALSLGDIVNSNGVDDALWCVRFMEPDTDTRRAIIRAIMPAVERVSAIGEGSSSAASCIADIHRWLAGDDGVDLASACARSWCAHGWAAAEAARAAIGRNSAAASDGARSAAKFASYNREARAAIRADMIESLPPVRDEGVSPAPV